MALNRMRIRGVVPHTLAADCASGDVIVKGDLVGIALVAGKAGDRIPLAVSGVWTLPHSPDEETYVGWKVNWKISDAIVTQGVVAGPAVMTFGVAVRDRGDAVDVLLCPGCGSYSSGA